MSHGTQPYKSLVNEGQTAPVEQHPLTQQPQVVVHNVNSGVSTYCVEPGPSYQWCDFVMSLITFFCCNIWLSLLAIVYAANSYVSHGEKLYERSRRQKSLARIFWIIALVTGLVVWIVVIIAIAVAVNNAKQQALDFHSG